MKPLDYWRECVSTAAEDCGLTMTADQLEFIAYAVEGAHENYGMAFYSPPPSDGIAEIRREGQAALDKLQRAFDAYQRGSKIAVRRALRLYPDANISIQDDGEIVRY